MSDNAFHVALRQRLGQACSLENESERAEGVVQVCLQLLPHSGSGRSELVEASSLREKCHLVRAVLKTLVIDTSSVDSAVILIAHLDSTQPPEDRETYLDEFHVCLQQLFKRITNGTADFLPAVRRVAKAFTHLHSASADTQDLESSLENISVTDSTRPRRQVSSVTLTDLYTTASARTRVRRTLVQALLTQIFDETKASIADQSQRGLARLFHIPKPLLHAADPAVLTELLLIKFCQSVLDDFPLRESDDTAHLKISAGTLTRKTTVFVHLSSVCVAVCKAV